MNEFSLIDQYFKAVTHKRDDVLLGIGDDAACLKIPKDKELVISCDTLVADVHFLSTWDAYDIAWKAVMVNVSDMAAMGADPCWLMLALTLPEADSHWLKRFSQGIRDALDQYNMALIGGDTTHGPLAMNLTIHGLVPEKKAVKRNGAKPGDIVYVTGHLGGAAQAVYLLNEPNVNSADRAKLMQKLLHPQPRVDFNPYLREFASAAIDISDGLSSDLNHICTASNVGACLELDQIPIHPVVVQSRQDAIEFALQGGDDYELCFTVSSKNEGRMLSQLAQANMNAYAVGVIEHTPGLRAKQKNGLIVDLDIRGYSHF